MARLWIAVKLRGRYFPEGWLLVSPCGSLKIPLIQLLWWKIHGYRHTFMQKPSHFVWSFCGCSFNGTDLPQIQETLKVTLPDFCSSLSSFQSLAPKMSKLSQLNPSKWNLEWFTVLKLTMAKLLQTWNFSWLLNFRNIWDIKWNFHRLKKSSWTWPSRWSTNTSASLHVSTQPQRWLNVAFLRQLQNLLDTQLF